MNIIILGIIIFVLFIITWIVIGVNAVPYTPPMMPNLDDRLYNRGFRGALEYTQMKSDINNCISRIHNMEIENKLHRSCPLPVFETLETILKKLPNKTLLEEVRKRGLSEIKEILK